MSELLYRACHVNPQISLLNEVHSDATETKQVNRKQIKICEESPAGWSQKRAANR